MEYKELAPAYNELAHLLFMYQTSYINCENAYLELNVQSIKSEIDKIISIIHAHNILESGTNL